MASATQTLLSTNIKELRHFFFEQDLLHSLRSQLVARTGGVSYMHKREFHPIADGLRSNRFLIQTVPEQLGDDILDLTVLFDRPHLHRAHQIIGYVKRRFHDAILPESWFAGNMARA
jgi:hypothetical protein